jgi:hypothetical protein
MSNGGVFEVTWGHGEVKLKVDGSPLGGMGDRGMGGFT